MILTDDNFATIVRRRRAGPRPLRQPDALHPLPDGEPVRVHRHVPRREHLQHPRRRPVPAAADLWINFTVTVFQAIGLGYGKPREGLMEEPPRPKDAQILPRPLFLWLAFIGLVFAAVTLALIVWAEGAYDEIVAHTMGLVTFSLLHVFFSLETADEERTHLQQPALENPTLLKASAVSLLTVFLATTFGPLQRILDTTELTLEQWAICIVLASLIIVVAEVRKLLRRRTAANARRHRRHPRRRHPRPHDRRHRSGPRDRRRVRPPPRAAARGGDVRPGRRHVADERLDLGRRHRPRDDGERRPVGDRPRGPRLRGVHPDQQQGRRPDRTQEGLCPGPARLRRRRARDGARPGPAGGDHLLGHLRRPGGIAPAAVDAVAHPRQLRGRQPEARLRARRRLGGHRGGHRPAPRRVHHDLPVVAGGLPARAGRHRPRPGRDRPDPRRALHRRARHRPRRRRPVGLRHGRARARDPRLAGRRRGRRCAARDRRGVAGAAGLVAGAPQARRQAGPDRPGPVPLEDVPPRDLRPAAPAGRPRRRDDHAADLLPDGPRVQRAPGGAVAGPAVAEHVLHGHPRGSARRATGTRPASSGSASCC